MGGKPTFDKHPCGAAYGPCIAGIDLAQCGVDSSVSAPSTARRNQGNSMILLQRAACVLIAIVALIFAAYPAAADNYPSRTVKSIFPFGAGGPAAGFKGAGAPG